MVCWYGMMVRFDTLYGKIKVCYMVCWWYGIWEKQGMWYGVLVVWYDGTMWWMYYMAKLARWYGMFQYIRGVRVEYVVRISSVTTLYIDHWNVFKHISRPDWQTDRQIGRQVRNYRNWDSVLNIGIALDEIRSSAVRNFLCLFLWSRSWSWWEWRYIQNLYYMLFLPTLFGPIYYGPQ